jgi:SH3-like domain-containing protein
MKTNGWLILGLMMATSVLAQNNTNTLPPIPAPAVEPTSEVAPEPAATNAPVKHKKHVAAEPKRAAINEPTVTLSSGAAQVAVNDLNVRGQAGLKGEVVTHLNKGDAVTVISQLNLDRHATGEPAQWAKIALPVSNHVWVNTKYIDAANKTVSAKKLNLRAGPGENFSVLGVIEQGTAVNIINTKGPWSEIEPPASAYAFVAAMYLKQEASGNLAANPPTSTETTPAAPMPAPTPTPVPEAAPGVTTPPATTETTAPAATNPSPAPSVTSPVVETAPVDTNPPPPRVVTHEGVVGPVGSIIAPTPYVLYDLSTRQNINFLYTTSTNLDIGRYSGMLIDVTGEESVAERWKDTPLLTIQRIVVLDTNAIPKVYFPTPRQRG